MAKDIKYSEDFINQVRFGNPSLQDYHNMKIKNYLDQVLPYLTTFHPPGNATGATKNELNQLIEYVSASRPGGKEIFDNSLVPFLNNLYTNNYPEAQADIEATTQQIVNDVLPVITKLKYYFQRPRPLQLAYYFNLQLFPTFSYFTSSPSYPSGHATLAMVLGNVLGNRYPETFDAMQEFITDVSESRLYMGVHYPTDNQMAVIICKAIVTNKEFQVKYGL
jgi:hypothetical protein